MKAALPSPAEVSMLLEDTLRSLVAKPPSSGVNPDPAVKPALDQLLSKPSTMRDGILILLAYAVASPNGTLDFRVEEKWLSEGELG